MSCYKFETGKHKNETIEHVFNTNKKYIDWCVLIISSHMK